MGVIRRISCDLISFGSEQVALCLNSFIITPVRHEIDESGKEICGGIMERRAYWGRIITPGRGGLKQRWPKKRASPDKAISSSGRFSKPPPAKPAATG
jgi:hypothetical protein